jgi:hypothetical protein
MPSVTWTPCWSTGIGQILAPAAISARRVKEYPGLPALRQQLRDAGVQERDHRSGRRGRRHICYIEAAMPDGARFNPD